MGAFGDGSNALAQPIDNVAIIEARIGAGMNRHIRPTLAAIVFMVLLTACGSNAGPDSTTTTSTSDSTTTLPGGSTPLTSGTGGITQACLDTAQAFSGALVGYATVVNGLSPDQAQAYRDQLADALGKMPAELREDFEVINDVLEDFYEGIAAMNLTTGVPMTPAQVTNYSELAEDLNEAPFAPAMQRVTAWFQTNCS